jgi:hypothetical protein
MAWIGVHWPSSGESFRDAAKPLEGDIMDATTSTILDGYLTKSRLAEELGTTKRTIDRWHQLRIGPPRTVIGRKILYRIEAVREWLESREQRKAVR